MISTGLYRDKNSKIAIEKHGGVHLEEEIFWFLAVYEDGGIGYFGAGKFDYDLYLNRENIYYSGKILKNEESDFICIVYEPDNTHSITFKGKINDDEIIVESFSDEKYDKVIKSFVFKKVDY